MASAAPSAARLRDMVLEFTSFTGATERVAAKFIKASNYAVNEAVDEYFHQKDTGALPAPTSAAALVAQLNSMFDDLRDPDADPKNCIELTSTLNYLKHELKINVENAELMVVLELLQAPSIGEITREGYEHASYVLRLNKALGKDAVLFRRVYRHAFVAGRERDQKALSVENALVFWDMLFAQPGMLWKNANRDWLPLWKSFLTEKWTRSVNRDMWNMTLQFALKSMEDDSLSFWSEDGAWPSVIDDFVQWCKSKGIGGSQAMEVDDNDA
ncbi:defective in cullin neddylation protein 1 [Cordyceps fumosorosea ARSEF 2679]|uniref:Defective in cullin neddylation protein n=1 Tax=Cordyceps fumosorosea (strain ARSEF 2679) TaxID=1081104 RepID=A0A162LRT4_CORFA|nr:defective in cullin neddylation protein 1 [Cordyceps fumosorosea ARSEF 2679]OAA43570.1 defective in cullin neddylation protein 1 [Cordyceps fumosorosea ARSEF 2679]